MCFKLLACSDKTILIQFRALLFGKKSRHILLKNKRMCLMGHSFSAQIYFTDLFLNKKFCLKYQHFVTVLPFYPHAQLLKWNCFHPVTHSSCLVMWALCIRMGQTGYRPLCIFPKKSWREDFVHCPKGPLFVREGLVLSHALPNGTMCVWI